MDRKTVSEFQREIGAAIEAVAKARGLKIGRNTASYDPTIGTVKITMNFSEADTHAKQFTRYASLFGLKPEALGAVFTIQGRPFTISGIRPKSRTKPVLAIDALGREFIFAVAAVVRANPGVKGETFDFYNSDHGTYRPAAE